MAGTGCTIFLHSFMKKLSLFETAYIISHECQHILKRPIELIYSPSDYPINSKIFEVFSRLNKGVPIESGHLY